jgi:VWFA-related protein
MWRNIAGLLALSTLLAQTPAPDFVLRFEVNLVQVDAIVTDSHGRHIPGLKAEDFEVLQDGKPQKITHFSYIAAGSPATRDAPAPATLPPLAPTKAEARRTLVFLIDDEHMDFGDFHYAQQALARYVQDGVQPGDIVAIARTSFGSGAMQVFTSDTAWLRSTLYRMLWRPPLSVLESLHVHPVLNELQRTIRALTQYPGRKSIILIGPGLPAGDTPDYWASVRQTADSANRASVTIETIDCRGLPTLQPTAADPMPSPFPNPRTGMSEQMLRSSDYFHSQDVLAFLAEMTAGRFQHESNDIAAQVRTAAQDSEGYYLIGWYPASATFQSKPGRPLDYHRVKISLRNKTGGLSVRTRDGFFAYPGSGAKVAYTAAQQMNDALFSPFRSGDIDVRLTASLGYDEHGGAYIESLLHILPTGVILHDVPGHDDCKLVDLEILTSPEPLDTVRVPIGHIDGEHPRIQVCKHFDGLMRDGLVVAVRKQIPVSGPYQMRVAVRNWKEGDAPSVGQKGLIHRASMEPEQTAIGSANQIVEVPDARNRDALITGIGLRSGAFQDPGVIAGLSLRIASPADPAVRLFHPGESLT